MPSEHEQDIYTTQEIVPEPAWRTRDRRGAERADVEIQLTFRFGTVRMPTSIGTVLDLSSTGLFVQTLRKLKAKTRLLGVLRGDPTQPSERGINFVGEVAWAAPYPATSGKPPRRAQRPQDAEDGSKRPGFGVRFVQMSPEDHTVVRRIVATHRRPTPR